MLTTMLMLRADRLVATVTAHHLYLTVQDSYNPFAFCKPVPKTEKDRDALIRAVCSGDPKFFLYVTMMQLYSSRTDAFYL
jgi:dihydroorotase